MHKNLTQWLDYWLNQHSINEIELGLERVAAVKDKMQLAISCPLIIVAGTNGKGSTCAFLTEIYKQAGYTVGTLSSPHLLRFNERICISGNPISDEEIINSFEKIDQIRAEIPLTYFEVNTLAAVDIFIQHQVDVMVLEVGLGGRLDAVNIFDADVAIVTNIALEHQEYLGHSKEEIGIEKAGIFRAGKPAIIGEVDAPNSLTHYATQINAEIFQLATDFGYRRLENQWSFYYFPQHKPNYTQHTRHALPIPALRGRYQINNAGCALCAIECLTVKLPVDVAAIKRGLLQVKHPGRFQILPGRPMVVWDVAHNPHAANELKANLILLPYAKQRIAIFSMLADKDIDSVINILNDSFDKWYIATLNTKRALNSDKIKEVLVTQCKRATIKQFDSIKIAYEFALAEANESDRIVVFGSFYTVSEVMPHQ